MAANPADPSVSDPSARDAERICVNCGKAVSPDRRRTCNHCGLPFRDASDAGPAIEEPGSAGRMLLRLFATLACALPPLGPLSSLSGDPATVLGFLVVVIAGAAAVVLAWRRPLPGGILVFLVGSVPFVAELILDATGVPDPSSRYWLFWFFPGSLVGGALFLAAAFWQPGEAAQGVERAAAEPPGRVSLARRARREAIGLAALVAVGLVFAAVVASSPEGAGSTQPAPRLIVIAGFPMLLVGAGVLGYREGRAPGSFVAGLAAAVVALAGIAVALAIAGRTLFQVGEGEWIGEAWLVAGLMIAGGGFFGLLGGGIAAVVGSQSRPLGRP